MATAIQTRISQLGLAKQSAKGSSAGTTATYGIGVSSGTLAKADVGEEALPLTWSDRIIQGHDRITVLPGFEFETVLLPKTAGLLVLGATGTDTVTGVGPYTHTCKPALDLPYLGVFGTLDQNWVRIDDAKIDSLELTFDRAGAVRAKCSGMGCGYTVLASAYTTTTPEAASGGYFDAAGSGGTMTVNGSPAIVKQGSVKITNKLGAIFGATSVLPNDVFPGEHALDISLTIVPADLSLFKLALTGSTSGTSPAAAPTYTTASLKWVLDANTDITLTVNRMKTLVDFPPANPAGGPAEITLVGQVAAPSGATDGYTLAVRNGVASY